MKDITRSGLKVMLRKYFGLVCYKLKWSVKSYEGHCFKKNIKRHKRKSIKNKISKTLKHICLLIEKKTFRFCQFLFMTGYEQKPFV